MRRDDGRDGERTIKLFAVVFLLCVAIGVALHPDQWYIPFALVGAVSAFAVALVGAERGWELLRRCPRCGRRGFASIHDSEKETPAGDQFFQVAHCRRCGLYRLECGAEVRELDPGRWEDQMREWQEGPPNPPLHPTRPGQLLLAAHLCFV